MNPIFSLYRLLSDFKSAFYRNWIKKQFLNFGEGAHIEKIDSLSHPEKISVGQNVYIGHHSVLEAITKKCDKSFNPEITIGDNTRIGDYSHLGSIRFIHVGKNVLMGRYVLIIDHSHGDTADLNNSIPPFERDLKTKGGITIGDDVWIGDKVSILSGVTIGEGAIIGANSVVVKDVPAHNFAAGSPAKVILVDNN